MDDEEKLLDNNETSLLDIDDADDLFIKPQKKHKVLMLSDHQLAPSGVGIQARFLIQGLVATGRYSFRCLGGAIKHQNYNLIKVNDDFIIKPVDGFGSKELIRELLIQERPDALMLFTDPRQFIWLWEMEDEIHQICPIVYWHVWDNDPYPKFNSPWYDSCELINCLAQKTYDLVKPNYPEKTNYVPHAFPKNVYFPLQDEQIKQLNQQNFGPRADWFKALWVNRNAVRKMPADLLVSWKLFLDKLEKKHGHRNALLIMHTDPKDREGPDLLAVTTELGLSDNVWFSTDKVDFPQMNILHNLCDTAINISKNEGFGLTTLASLQCGRPVVALCTGGETSKVLDPDTGFEYGAAIQPAVRTLVGSQLVPYIYEDIASHEDVANGCMKVFEMTPQEKADMKQKAVQHVHKNFSFERMISEWDRTLDKCINEWKENGKNNKWHLTTLNPIVDVSLSSNKGNNKQIKKKKVASKKRGKKNKS